MRVESVTALGFGALQGPTLTFDPGLNVVCGRNESAKSTWQAAVYAAICGRSRKRGAGTRAQQEFAARYRPWDGTTWEVEATLRLDDGRAIGMHHDLDGQVNCAATDLTTGLDLSAEVMYEGSPDASRWLGMNRDIFSAIACVRQADILSVLGSARALQEQLEGAATHAGTSDPTAAQAIGIIGAFLKENVGKDRANSTKPLRRAIEDVSRHQQALDEARGQHEQYMDLVRDAARLRAEVAQREADVARLTEHRNTLQDLTALTTALNTARAHSSSLTQRLQVADSLRDQGADRPPVVADDTRTLTEVTSAVTRWRNLPEPQVLTGPDSATLRAQLACLPEPPVGDQRVDPVVAQALRRLQIAQELAAQKKREEPAVPVLSPQAQSAAGVGAVTLRAWAAELDRFEDASTEHVAGPQMSMRDAAGLVAGAVAAIAGIALVLTGSTAVGVSLVVVGFVVAVVGRRRTSSATQSPALAHESASARHQAVKAQAEAASLPAQAQALRTLAAEVERWDQLNTRRTIWEAQIQAAATTVDAARRALSDSLALRGVIDADPEVAYVDYEAACERRSQQSAMAGRREVLAEQLLARTTAESARSKLAQDTASARTALSTAAKSAGLDTDDPTALEQWIAQQQAAASELGAQQDAWTRYQRVLGDLTHDRLRSQAQEAQAQVSRLEQQVQALGHVEDDPAEALATAQSSLAASETELIVLREAAAIAQGKQQDRADTLASVAEAEERLALAQRELARVRELESRLQVTRHYLQDAQDTVHRSIAPTLQATLLRWLPTVTDGRYTHAAVDPETLRVTVKTGSGKWVEASKLSMGTAEQVYLLLRVALVTHLSDPATSCPLLLDDVTVQADEHRTHALLDALAQIATQRQVILFAQEPAVQRWASDRDGVRLISLEQVPA